MMTSHNIGNIDGFFGFQDAGSVSPFPMALRVVEMGRKVMACKRMDLIRAKGIQVAFKVMDPSFVGEMTGPVPSRTWQGEREEKEEKSASVREETRVGNFTRDRGWPMGEIMRVYGLTGVSSYTCAVW